MKLERLRWILLPAAAISFLVMLVRGATPGRIVFTALCALAWYALSRLKVHSLDRGRLAGGKLGRRP